MDFLVCVYLGMYSVPFTHEPIPQFSSLLCETTLLKVMLAFSLPLSFPPAQLG